MAEYRISQVADRTGFSRSALRFYEQTGLLPDTARTPGGYRTYDDRAVDRLRFIARAKQLGLPLGEIRELAAAWDSGACAPVQDCLAALLDGKIADVAERIRELTEFRSQLAAAREVLGVHTPDGPCDDACGCVSQPPTAKTRPQVVSLLTTRPDNLPVTAPDTGPPVACTLDGADQ